MAVALAVLAMLPAVAAAGSLSIRNDTHSTLVVQEIVTVNGQARRGQQKQLLSGEVAVESVAGAGVKRLIAFDPRQPTVILLTVDVKYTGADQTLSLQVDPPTAAGLPPRYKLVPAIPARPGQPGMMGKPPGG